MTKQQRAVEELERPTSGKHFSRYAAKNLSDIGANYEKGKHLQGMMSKLAEYMADVGLDDLGSEKKQKVSEV